MPELPELELLRTALTAYASGKTILAVIPNPARAFVIRYPPMDFVRDLNGRTIDRVERRGKFLLFRFRDDGPTLVINPMLSGRFAYCSRGAPVLAATCFTLQLSGAEDIRFLDSTMMARVYLTRDPAADVPAFADLGPDALDPDLDFATFAVRLRRHRGELKNALRNQAFLAGIGNAYADEILWSARLRPLRRASTLDDTERKTLYDAIRSVLADSVATVQTQHAQGLHPLHKQVRSFMKVHGKGKAVCPRCGHRISSVHAGGESTFFCRGCQV
ncbi:MAG TPA: DNA-formamidopyrimidine glycosylase family protein [Candidatus Acidoferrales bacterium]|nr:DNA-formamidopyrimidine glycosylase family protein [Candidatus Acidoferrales bacterium]